MNIRRILFYAFSFCSLPAFAQDWAAHAVFPLGVQVPGTQSFKFVFEKIGTTTVNPYTVYWQLDNGPVHSVSKSSISTDWFGAKGLVKDTAMKLIFAVPGNYALKAWIEVPGDVNASNDTLTQAITVYEAMPKKNVLLEIYKHQACGPCYGAAVFTDTLIAKNPDYAVANIYTMTSDVIYNAEGAAVNTEYGFAHPGRYSTGFQYHLSTTLQDFL